MQQTEPNSDLSTSRYNGFKKTEFWYMLHKISSFEGLTEFQNLVITKATQLKI